MKVQLKFNFTVLFLLLFVATILAQHERTQDFNETWSGVKTVEVNHQQGRLEILPYEGSEVKLSAQILVRARDSEDAQIVVDHFEIDGRKSGDKLTITTEFNTSRRVTTNNNTSLKFEDGDKASGVKEIKINYTLHVPALELLSLSNKYNSITVNGDYQGDLHIKQYDASVNTDNVSGDLDINIKYGKANVGQASDVKLETYDSQVEIAGAKNIEVKGKYSKSIFGDIESADINYFDGECSIAAISGDLQITDKYSEFDIGSAQNAQVDIYDGKIYLKQVSTFKIKSKYAQIKIDAVKDLNANASYDDDFTIGTVDIFTCDESKYSGFTINSLSQKAILTSSFDDKLVVSSVSSEFEQFEMESKYTAVNLPLHTLKGYTIDAQSQYGSISIQGPTDYSYLKETNSTREMKGQVGEANSKATVKIKAYDSNIKLK